MTWPVGGIDMSHHEWAGHDIGALRRSVVLLSGSHYHSLPHAHGDGSVYNPLLLGVVLDLDVLISFSFIIIIIKDIYRHISNPVSVERGGY